MFDMTPMVADAGSDDMDALRMTMLAREWGARLPMLAVLKQFKDGKEMVDRSSVPAGLSPSAQPVYRLMRSIGTLNLARRISESVTDRQQPNGFRRINDRSLKDTAADDMYRQCMLGTILRTRLFPDVGDYGEAFALVGHRRGDQLIRALGPWECHVGRDGDAAIHYSYDPYRHVEQMRFFAVSRDGDGNVTRVYSRLATRETDRTVTDPSDDDAVDSLVESQRAWDPGADWAWDENASNEYEYAKRCGMLPIVRLSTPDGMGLYEPHLDTLKRIDREIFDRLCISIMQAFRQRVIKGDIERTYGPDDPEVVAGYKQEGDPIDLGERFATGPASLWQVPSGVDIWESATADLNGLQNVINSDIKHLAATAGIPLDILSPDVQGSASGAELKRETLKFKVMNLNMLAGDAISRMIRLALAIDAPDDAIPPTGFELMWKPVTTNSMLELAQAGQLAYQSGLMARRTVLARTFGFTAQDLAEDDANRLADQFELATPRNTTVMPAALTPATGWDATTGGAVNGLPDTFTDTDNTEDTGTGANRTNEAGES